MRFYIAFSIHGTNNYTVAVRETPEKNVSEASLQDHLNKKFGNGFSVVPTRMAVAVDPVAVKLHWDKLLRKDGKPVDNKSVVTRRFNQLKKAGWTIVQRGGGA